MSVYSSASGLAAIGLAIVIFALVGALTWFIAIPAWQVFLDVDSFWILFGVLAVGGILGSQVNIPLPFTSGGMRYAVNLLGFFGPLGVIIWTATDIELNAPFWVILPAIISLGLYLALTRAEEEGVKVPLLLLWGLGLADVLFFHYVAEMELRQVMWWSVTLQFGTLLVADVFRAVAHADEFSRRARMLSIGGAGSSDALWTGPIATLSFAYALQWIAWGGVDGLIP